MFRDDKISLLLFSYDACDYISVRNYTEFKSFSQLFEYWVGIMLASLLAG